MGETLDQPYEEQVRDFIASVYQLGLLSLNLARINRATSLGSDGVPESDTDHTVGVQLVALELAHHDPRSIDIGKVSILGLVHDIIEEEAGDTQTFYPDERLLVGKRAREQAGLLRMKERFGHTSSWLIEHIEEYEAGVTLESSLVHLADKITRPIAHLNDGCRVLLARKITVEEHDRNVRKTYELMAAHMERNPLAAGLLRQLDNEVGYF